jgi:hypothetical protein
MSNIENKKLVPKIFFGPMSKIAVDCLVKITEESEVNIGLLPSRRQIESGKISPGYVNNWTTEAFVDYLDGRITVMRDHAGPGQGLLYDDGKASIMADIECGISLIHIDPWKCCNSIEEAVDKTSDLMEFSADISKDVMFEVGTEESISPIKSTELSYFLELLKKKTGDLFSRVVFCVVQSGTSIKENKNIGVFNHKRSKAMCDIVRSHGLLAKEHNSDYLTASDFYLRKSSGVDAFNIAPELGVLQTATVLQNLDKFQLIDEKKSFLEACNASGKWKKWTNRSNLSLEEISILSGHYNFSTEEWEKCMQKLDEYLDIEFEIRSAMHKKITEILWATK